MKLVADMEAAEVAELENYMSQISASIEEELDGLLPEADDSEESRLFEAMRYSVFSGGKRIRPMLVMASNDILGGRPKRALRVASAMEALHTYSLIQDDLPCMDNDDLRRGKPTCHVQFDEHTAILASDALHDMCFEVLADEDTHPDPHVRCKLVQLFAQSAGAQGMIGGQMLDMMAEDSDAEVDQGALARLQRKKTGALFSACCEAAVILNGATREEHHRLVSYARNLGLAFQMVDDVLDEVGDRDTLGKTVGKDADAGKTTFASLLGVDGAKRQAEFLVTQSIDYLSTFGDRGRMLQLLAKFVVSRAH